MPPKKKSSKPADTKQAAPKRAKSSGTGKKATRKRAAGIDGKATEVMGEMLAGAAVGAVTGAASQVSDEPTAVAEAVATKKAPRKRASAKPTAVLGEMATGAAIGAVTGAAKAVLPAEKKPQKQAPKKK